MNLKDIERLAGHRNVSAWVLKLVLDAVSEEREACAFTCEQFQRAMNEDVGEDVNGFACARKIRARGNP
jgi:hypothetical protein